MTSLHSEGRHVLLPVDLRDPAVDPDGDDVQAILYNIFPETLSANFGRYRSFVSFQARKLPQQPWPLTVGDLPITIWEFKIGRGMIDIYPELNDRDFSAVEFLRRLTEGVHDKFVLSYLQVRLLELMYMSNGAIYAILTDVDVYSVLAGLLAKIANRLVGYFRESDLKRSRCANLPARDASAPIGHRTCHLSGSFTGDVDGVGVMTSVKIDGSLRHTEKAATCWYIVYNWEFLGQEEGATDKTRPPSGTCGSAVWNEDGVVLGFCHYYLQEGPFAGFSASVDASEVATAGYRLSLL